MNKEMMRKRVETILQAIERNKSVIVELKEKHKPVFERVEESQKSNDILLDELIEIRALCEHKNRLSGVCQICFLEIPN